MKRRNGINKRLYKTNVRDVAMQILSDLII